LRWPGPSSAEVTALSVSSAKGGLFATGRDGEHFSPEVCRNTVEYVAGEGRKIGIAVNPEIVAGSPAGEIVRASGEHDLIVMGTSGRTGLRVPAHQERGQKDDPACPVPVVRSNEKTFYKRLLER